MDGLNLMTRYRINRCYFCHEILWPWQSQGNKNFGKPAHMRCIDKSFWTPENIERFGDRHFGYFGKRPWDNI